VGKVPHRAAGDGREAVKLKRTVKSGKTAAAADEFIRVAAKGCAGCHCAYRERVGLPF